jgi:uncharacterized YccA/Bax inhibitor family protein
MFHVDIAFIHEGSLGIGFSLFVVDSALNLLLDFDMIEKGVAAGAPKYGMVWCFRLLVNHCMALPRDSSFTGQTC